MKIRDSSASAGTVYEADEACLVIINLRALRDFCVY